MPSLPMGISTAFSDLSVSPQLPLGEFLAPRWPAGWAQVPEKQQGQSIAQRGDPSPCAQGSLLPLLVPTQLLFPTSAHYAPSTPERRLASASRPVVGAGPASPRGSGSPQSCPLSHRVQSHPRAICHGVNRSRGHCRKAEPCPRLC